MIDWSQIKPEEEKLEDDLNSIGGHFTKAIRGNDNQVYGLGVSYTKNRLVTDATISRLNFVSGEFSKENSPTYTMFTPFNCRFTSAITDDLDNVVAVGQGIQTPDSKIADTGIVTRIDSNLKKITGNRKHLLTLEDVTIQDIVFNPKKRVYILLCNSPKGSSILELNYDFEKTRQLNLKVGYGEKLILTKDGTCDYIVVLTVQSQRLSVARFSDELKPIVDIDYDRVPIANPNIIWHDDLGLIIIGSHASRNDANDLILDIACLDPANLSLRRPDNRLPFGIRLNRESNNYGLSATSDGSIIISCIPLQETSHSLIRFNHRDDNTYASKCSYPENIIEDVVALDEFIAAVGKSSVTDDGNVKPLIEKFEYNN